MEPLPFSKLMGLTIVSVAPDCVRAELPVREDLCTRPPVLHGGAVMAFADTLGAIATIANLPAGAGTTTIESKTNFFAAIPAGDVAKAECTPLHRGRIVYDGPSEELTRDPAKLDRLIGVGKRG